MTVAEKNINLTISLKSSFYLKGIAILMIMLHNFFHWLPPKIGENEMVWSLLNGQRFLHTMILYPTLFWELFWSFLGFFGVPVFVLLSGYGLTQSLMTKKEKIFPFICRHIIKVYILFLISVDVYALYKIYQGTLSPKVIHQIFQCLSLTNNFFPQRIFMLNGPWWFFSLIIQLYIIYPIIFYLLKKSNKVFFVLLFLCYMLIYFLGYAVNINTTYIFANFLGHLPEFMLGIFLSLYKSKMIWIYKKFVIYASFTVVILSFYVKYLFPISFLTSAVLIVGLFLKLQRVIEDKFYEKFLITPFVYLGKISPFLFGFNGFLRHAYIRSIANKYSFWEREWAFCKWLIMCILLASLFHFFRDNKQLKTNK